MILVIALGARSNREILQLKRAEQNKFLATDFLMRLRTAESSQRGYLVTGNPRYLRGYNAVADSLPLSLSHLEAATSAEPLQRRRLAIIRSQFELKRREMSDALQQERAGHRIRALAMTNSDLGFREMGEIETEIQGVIAFEEKTSLGVRNRYDSIYFISLFVLVSIVALGFVTFSLVKKFIRSSIAQRIEISDSNGRLMSLVETRTAEIARVNEEIQRYAYIVGHDLRGPLINIIGFTAELQRAETILQRQINVLKVTKPSLLDPDIVDAVELDIPEALRFITVSTARMDRLIAAVLKLSREGRRALLAEPINMAALINDLADCQAQQLESGGALISIGDLPDLVSDRMAVELVFGNLLENAVKYLDPARAGRIEISGAEHGDRNIYEVRDNGRGIAAADSERVFELFRRAGDQEVTGEGVGLAYVRNAIYRLDGRLTLSSVVGEGTRFCIDLPARLDAPGAPDVIAA